MTYTNRYSKTKPGEARFIQIELESGSTRNLADSPIIYKSFHWRQSDGELIVSKEFENVTPSSVHRLNRLVRKYRLATYEMSPDGITLTYDTELGEIA